MKNIYRFCLLWVLSIFSTVSIAQEFSGQLTWSKRVELSTPISGVVQDVFAKPAQQVAKGDVLLQLDPRSFKSKVQALKAQLLSDDENLKEAKREMQRAQELYDRTVLSDHDLQTAKNLLVNAQAKLQKVKSELSGAKLQLEYSAIRAPFNAVVLDVNAVKGQVVSAKLAPPVLVTIAEAGRMIARINLTNEQLSEISSKQGAKVVIEDYSYPGTIEKMSLEADKNGLYSVDVIFDPGKKLLFAGKKVKVTL